MYFLYAFYNNYMNKTIMPGDICHLFHVQYMDVNLVNLSLFMFSLNQIICDCDISLNVYLKASAISYCYCTMATNIKLIRFALYTAFFIIRFLDEILNYLVILLHIYFTSIARVPLQDSWRGSFQIERYNQNVNFINMMLDNDLLCTSIRLV